MGKKTKIDWCDATWNPVTGCLHGCEYCYAKRIAKRFGSAIVTGHDHLYVIDEPFRKGENGPIAPYPFGFDPTFHYYRLDEPRKWREPRTIFVCSMADLFGEWVPDEWIQLVFDACIAAPQHRYLFLTKNPSRYMRLYKDSGIVLPNTIDWWYGYTIDGLTAVPKDAPILQRVFCSVEPLQIKPTPHMLKSIALTSWVIIGAETGNRKGKVIPEKAWIDAIVDTCRNAQIPVFMKESLRVLMGDDFRQEVPWI